MVYFNRLKLTEHSFVLIVAVFIGLLGGYGAVLIQLTIRWFQKLFWQGTFSLNTIESIDWYWRIIIPVFGGLVVGLIIQYYAREAKGHGVPEVMEAIALHNGVIRPRVVIAKLFSSAIYIASGGSVGREGPVIQIGSAVGSSVGQFFKVNPKRMRVFVACGAASGIAAAFNAPVAGALFAVEIILGDFAVPQFSPIVISSVAATIVSRHYLGNHPAFEVPKYEMVSPLELINYVVLGFLAGLTAVAFIRTLYYSEDFFDNLKMPDYVKGVIGGLCIGGIGLVFPYIYGVGYDAMDMALYGHLIWQIAAVLVVVKILATSISLGSGGSGGIFAPSLFMGAMLGVTSGHIVNLLFPSWTASPGAYALVAMGGVVGAATHGPITAILIIFEMTNDYKIILPLMITTIIATLLAMRLQNESIYTLKLIRRGINIFGGREINVLKSLRVSSVANNTIDLVSVQTQFEELLPIIVNSGHNQIYVVDEKQKIIGYISMQEIRQTIMDYDTLKHLLIAADIVNPNIPVVREDETLDRVMKLFGETGLEELPVVSADGDEQILGTITQRSVIDAYNQQIFLRDMAGESGRSIREITKQKRVHVIGQHYFDEIEVPMSLVGKTFREAAIRNRFNLEVLMIRRKEIKNGKEHSYYFQPNADTRLNVNDVLLVFGNQEAIQHFEKA
ncbi:MAG: CBS domain-containing protein [Calditrichaeota bacterium]|nr:CBS domain-containing protein [Calditrichota bacterium]